MDECIFCQIAKNTAPSSQVYSDEKVIAFLDTQPVNSGHTLIIPRTHIRELAQLDEEIGEHMFKVAMRVDAALRRSGLKCDGVTLHLADGEAASQDVFHIHLHVIPRFKGDGFGIRFGPDYGQKPSRKELDQVAKKIADALYEK